MIDPITLDQLRVFLTVRDAGSFSAAARRLRRAQSAVSRAVIMLERSINIELFDRSGYAPKLTEFGATLSVEARAIVARIDDFKARASAMAGDLEPNLGIGVHFSILTSWLIPVLRTFQREFPLVPINLHTGGIGAVLDKLLDGACNICVCPVPVGIEVPMEIRLLERNLVTTSTHVTVAAPSHPLSTTAAPVTIADLRLHTQLIITERSTLTRRWEEARIVGERVWRVADLRSKRDFLLAGFGWANMPLHIVSDDLAESRLKRILIAERASWQEPAPIYIGFNQSRPPGRAARWLIEEFLAQISRLSNTSMYSQGPIPSHF